MKPFFTDPFEANQKNEQDEHAVVIIDESQHTIAEGGEFLDDAIRMIDQPLINIEESVVPGSPEGIW